MRDRPLILHGDGLHSRRYLYAGDAADAFDMILHQGETGQVYNVDSRDEFTNFELAHELLTEFGKTGDHDSWIEFTKDRPFNDRRYAVDGSKLRQLGWKQRIPFSEGLRATIAWYKQFGGWWGEIDNVLTGHPVVKDDHTIMPEGSISSVPGGIEMQKELQKDVTIGAEGQVPMSNGSSRSDDLYKVVKKRKYERVE